MNSLFFLRKKTFLLSLFSLILLCSCTSHLRQAKLHFAQGEKLSRDYKTEMALASFKSALREAEKEAKNNPSAQAYMVKGLAELKLELWEKAENSFLSAFSLGFEEGEEWAKELSLFGLASSFQELGLEDSASGIYFSLIEKSKLKPLSLLSAQRYMDITLKRSLQKSGKERGKMLTDLQKSLERLTSRDMSFGFYHYLQSQIYSHLAEYRKSFEQAVMARELGLPSQEIYRDNDNQIVFCYQNMKEGLSPEEWKEFRSLYLGWVKRWGWDSPEMPDWKRK